VWSPERSIKSTSPRCARSIAKWTIVLSCGAVRTVKAGPTTTPRREKGMNSRIDETKFEQVTESGGFNLAVARNQLGR